MLFGGKLLSTFGFGLGHSLGPVFVAELAPTSLRGICLTLIVSTFHLLFSIVSTKLTVCNSEHHDRHRTVDLCIGSLWLLAPHHQFSMAYSYHHSAYSARNSSSHRCPLSSRVSILASYERPTRRCSKVLSQIQRTKIRRRVSHCDHRRSNQSREALNEEASSWIDCFKGPNLRRTIIICMVYIAQQFIGVNFIAGYLAYVATTSRFPPAEFKLIILRYFFLLAGVNNPLGIAQSAYAIQLFGNICSWPLVDRFWKTTSYRLWHHDHDSQSSPHRWSRNPSHLLKP